MSPALRKFALIVHLTASVGWIGAVIAYLTLVTAAMTNQDGQILRAIWLALELLGWFCIVPLGLTSLLTGLIMSLGTKWGLFRHYWVVFSLILTVAACIILLEHMQTVSYFAGIAAQMNSDDIEALRGGLDGELLHGGAGLMVLLAVQVLNVYKPRGMTPYGWRKQREQHFVSPVSETSN